MPECQLGRFGPMMGGKALPWLLLAGLAACSPPDYTPVRDWAGVAEAAAHYPELTPAPRQTTARQAPIAQPDQTEAMRAMQQALGMYLNALGTLAADGLLMLREDPLRDLVPRVAPVNEAGARAIEKLGALLRQRGRELARAPQLRAMIRDSDEAVQGLIQALSETVSGVMPAEDAARQASAAHYARLMRDAHDAPTRAILAEISAMRDEAFANRAAARANYLAVLGDIAAGHKLLAERLRHLTQEETQRQIRAAEASLRRAATALPRDRLGLAVPQASTPQ